ncbi:MAG: ComEC/Rec2 family competence protein, partial [Candidatus Puniceispirillaceae bacterium]
FCFGVYGLLCSFMALPLQISQRWPHHKIAAIIAIASGLFYLLLAGTPISAIRAFAMAGLILCAALWDRRTVTLRNLNYVFVLFLIMMPSALYQPAFQLSFAATYGIVCFHIYVKSSGIFKEHTWGRRIIYLTATSVIAIIATAPITIYHFGALSVWGVLSNMVAIPFTAIVIMPLCMMYLAAFSAGLSEIIAPLLTFALSGLIWFAKMMASLPYSLVPVKPIPPVYLPVFGLCGIALYLANRKGRFVAGTIIVFFVLVWSAQNRPVGALYWQDRYVRFAFLDGRVLHHTGRLTNFWHDNYEKLLGPFDNTKQHKCRDICRISTPSYDVTINLQAPSLLICLTGISGETNCQPMVLPQSGYHMKLFYNNALGHYIEARKKPVRPKIWHGD